MEKKIHTNSHHRQDKNAQIGRRSVSENVSRRLGQDSHQAKVHRRPVLPLFDLPERHQRLVLLLLDLVLAYQGPVLLLDLRWAYRRPGPISWGCKKSIGDLGCIDLALRSRGKGLGFRILIWVDGPGT